jgi:hypothetical protein
MPSTFAASALEAIEPNVPWDVHDAAPFRNRDRPVHARPRRSPARWLLGQEVEREL